MQEVAPKLKLRNCTAFENYCPIS